MMRRSGFVLTMLAFGYAFLYVPIAILIGRAVCSVQIRAVRVALIGMTVLALGITWFLLRRLDAA